MRSPATTAAATSAAAVSNTSFEAPPSVGGAPTAVVPRVGVVATGSIGGFTPSGAAAPQLRQNLSLVDIAAPHLVQKREVTETLSLHYGWAGPR